VVITTLTVDSSEGYEGETIWLDDMPYALAGVNAVSASTFSWAALQPDEHTFTFEWLDRCWNSGRNDFCLSGTVGGPRWLSAPILKSCRSTMGPCRHGGRMNFVQPPDFRHFAHNLVRCLAERYCLSGLAAWHVSNEYGRCAATLRDAVWTWLQAATAASTRQSPLAHFFWSHIYRPGTN
jgi:beta-galactosidase